MSGSLITATSSLTSYQSNKARSSSDRSIVFDLQSWRWGHFSGWAGSYGQDSCACGVNGNCDGGRDALCNCDSATNKWKEDFGEITQKDRLPVCQVNV